MKYRLLILVFLTSLSTAAYSADVVTTKNIGMELARDIASAAVKACNKMGYQVSAVVVDRSATLRAALRDDYASRFTLEIAQKKANMSIMAGMDSGPFRKLREDIRPDLNTIEGLVVMEGGILIVADGNRIGAIGVSGAPGGDKDVDCAKKGIEAHIERIEFGD